METYFYQIVMPIMNWFPPDPPPLYSLLKWLWETRTPIPIDLIVSHLHKITTAIINYSPSPPPVSIWLWEQGPIQLPFPLPRGSTSSFQRLLFGITSLALYTDLLLMKSLFSKVVIKEGPWLMRGVTWLYYYLEERRLAAVRVGEGDVEEGGDEMEEEVELVQHEAGEIEDDAAGMEELQYRAIICALVFLMWLGLRRLLESWEWKVDRYLLTWVELWIEDLDHDALLRMIRIFFLFMLISGSCAVALSYVEGL